MMTSTRAATASTLYSPQNGIQPNDAPLTTEALHAVQERMAAVDQRLVWLQGLVHSRLVQLIGAAILLLALVGVIQTILLVWNGLAVSRFTRESHRQAAQAYYEAALANRPIIEVTPREWICPDASLMHAVATDDPTGQACTLVLGLTNPGKAYAAESIVIEEINLLAEGRGFEPIKGISYAVGSFTLAAGAQTMLELPFLVTGAAYLPAGDADVIQVHLQLKHKADATSGAGGEYWYRYHWQHSPRGFSLKNSESQIPSPSRSVI